MALPTPAPLSASEFESLKELNKWLLRKSIPENDKHRLIELGYANDWTGSHTFITDLGKLRLAQGN